MYALMELIFSFDKKARAAIEKGADVGELSVLAVRESIGRAKTADPEHYAEEYAEIDREIDREIELLLKHN